MAINIKTVITELQFILELANDSPSDKRLPGLLADAQTDLATAAKSISGDNPIITKAGEARIFSPSTRRPGLDRP